MCHVEVHQMFATKMSTMEGSLSKWTNVVNGWQYRWFVLDDNAGLLSYYTVSIFSNKKIITIPNA